MQSKSSVFMEWMDFETDAGLRRNSLMQIVGGSWQSVGTYWKVWLPPGLSGPVRTCWKVWLPSGPCLALRVSTASQPSCIPERMFLGIVWDWTCRSKSKNSVLVTALSVATTALSPPRGPSTEQAPQPACSSSRGSDTGPRDPSFS